MYHIAPGGRIRPALVEDVDTRIGFFYCHLPRPKLNA
jgi:hypothetical protein